MNNLVYNIHLENCKKVCKKKKENLLKCLKENDDKIKYCYIERYNYEKCLMKYVNKEEKL
tara:strand:+ start:254 stop:433 length:180 start_codon:yes stop_codon:yes gene_type:complete